MSHRRSPAPDPVEVAGATPDRPRGGQITAGIFQVSSSTRIGMFIFDLKTCSFYLYIKLYYIIFILYYIILYLYL